MQAKEHISLCPRHFSLRSHSDADTPIPIGRAWCSNTRRLGGVP
jgi:hypothetical protein